jgi:hypothetical protein
LVFDQNRYFDVFVEYAKESPEYLVIQISVHNRGPAAAELHVLALVLVDDDFAKQPLELMLQERYLHPNGQLPAYEWNFGDVNPPVHAWSTIFSYRLAKGRQGQGDLLWLERAFQKLVVNFTWWVNRKDRSGRNVFEGGFLDWITSASSTAAPPCRPAATSNRPTAPPGLDYSL